MVHRSAYGAGAKLAQALIEEGRQLVAEGREEEALDHYREALGILRDLHSRSPDVYCSELANSLLEVGRSLFRRDLFDKAPDLAGCIEEGLGLMIAFAGQHPEAHREQRALPLASSLLSLLESGTLDENLHEFLATFRTPNRKDDE